MFNSYLIGIDDTDNLDGPGTGHRVRQLAVELQAAGLVLSEGITRHQLLVSPEIPYTSHNSSACLTVAPAAAPAPVEEITRFCREFLLRESATGIGCRAVCGRVGIGWARDPGFWRARQAGSADFKLKRSKWLSGQKSPWRD